jgi:large subunit ribosomal protein L28
MLILILYLTMRSCSLCGKGTKVGRLRSHAQNRTPRTYKANIQKVTLVVGEDRISGKFCTKCLKRIKREAEAQKTASKK